MFTGNMVYKCLKLQLLINIRATCLLLEFEFIMFTFTFMCPRIFFYQLLEFSFGKYWWEWECKCAQIVLGTLLLHVCIQ